MPNNRIKVGVPLYRMVDPLFFEHWHIVLAELARASKNNNAGWMSTVMPYIDWAANTIVDQSLACACGHVWSLHLAHGNCKFDDRQGNACSCQKLVPAEKWDYLVLIEDDNIVPEGWIERVITTYDKPIAGLIYFGKADDDQRPIPGWLTDGVYRRLEFDKTSAWIETDQGFHEVDTIGMGCTAIRRDVLENWNPWMMPWFKTDMSPPNQILGQDIHFCMAAAKQGHKIYVDTGLIDPATGLAKVADHIGRWRSSYANYKATNEFHQQHFPANGAKPNGHLTVAPLTEPVETFEHGERSVDILVPPLE